MPSASPTFGPHPCAAGNIVTLVRKDGLRISLHRELVSLVSMLMDLTEMRGYNIVPGWTWGHACRKISGTNVWSNHARGCAVDINAPLNPYASAAWHVRNAVATVFGLRRRTNIPQWVFELWEAHGFYAGVRYESKPDPMHLEFVRSVVECRAITKRLQAYLAHPANALPAASRGDTVYRIHWFTGEPTQSGDQKNVTAAYRVLSARCEGKTSGDPYIAVSAWWIPSSEDLKVWRSRGLKEFTTPAPLRASIQYYNGPFDNTKTY